MIEVIVRGVFIHKNTLLLCRNRKRGHLFLPGGHVEFNEIAQDALAREIREELGVIMQVGPLLGVCEAAFDQPPKKSERKTRRHHEINLVFKLFRRTDEKTDPIQWSSREPHIEFVWLDVKEMKSNDSRFDVLPKGVIPLVLGSDNHVHAWS